MFGPDLLIQDNAMKKIKKKADNINFICNDILPRLMGSANFLLLLNGALIGTPVK